MWVFDGEQWFEEGNGDAGHAKPESRPRYEELMPELQVIEVVIPIPNTNTNYIPLPLP